MCRIYGEKIEMEKEAFDPTRTYKFVLMVRDNAGNESTFTSSLFKIDTTAPNVGVGLNANGWHKTKIFQFYASKLNNVGSLLSMGYCLNECKM